MSIRKIEQIEKMVDNPLEDFFNIEPASTKMIKSQRVTELEDYTDFDNKDKEIEQDYQEIADAAMSSFDAIQEMIDTADTKLVARLTEVSSQMLNTALAAVSKKASLKENKDRAIAKAKSGPNKTTNVLMVTDRNTALAEMKRMLNNDDIIDVDVVETNQEK
jgi:hypothetical protein